MTPWDQLRSALDARAEAGSPARFWLRDDDATEPGPALDRLLGATEASGVPVTLAVIPEPTGKRLARRLATAPLAEVAVHGWSHRNYAPEGQKSQELGLHRPAGVVLDELAAGLARLTGLHGARTLPLLVPPWNRIDAALVPALPGLGFSALSVFGPEQPGPLREINAHVDLIDWHGNRGGREPAILVAEILARMTSAPSGAVGLMTHHRVHDAAAWDFLDRLFGLTAGHPGCRWTPARALMAAE